MTKKKPAPKVMSPAKKEAWYAAIKPTDHTTILRQIQEIINSGETLTKWEADYLTDLGRLVGQFGAELRLSEKQKRVVDTIWAKKALPGILAKITKPSKPGDTHGN